MNYWRSGTDSATPGRRGTNTFRASLLERGREPQDSHPEVVLLDALLRRNVPVEPITERGMLCVERFADELTALYRDRAGAARVSGDPMGPRPGTRERFGTRVIDCKT
ncbi:MAG: hypothetical protein K0S92_821 [Desertimonas sp.]|nr:hypothetical protein [Desertimonas sp.]